MPRLTSKVLVRFGLLVASCIGILCFVRLRERATPEQVVTCGRELGLDIALGPAEGGYWRQSYRNSRFSLLGHPEIRGEIDRITVLPAATLTGESPIVVSGLSIDVHGEPSDLWMSTLGPLAKNLARATTPRMSISPIDVTYEHVVLGRLTLRGVTLIGADPDLVIRADTVSLPSGTWTDVTLAIGQRGDLIQVALGHADLKTAKLTLTLINSKHRGSEWMLNIAHQSLGNLLRRAGWQEPSIPEQAAIVGSITLRVVPKATEASGSLQLTFDNWPTPAWDDATPLLGQTLAVFARIAPIQVPLAFNLPTVEASTALFSLVGAGSLVPWGANASAKFDVAGSSKCLTLKSQLPPSKYNESVERFLATQAPLQAGKNPSALPLRLQLDAAGIASGRRVLAALLGPGCGLSQQQAAAFVPLNLPDPTATHSDAGTSR